MSAPVSAIIPCYNSAKTVERAVASVFAQTLVPAELILIDNASQDDTVEILRGLRERHGADRVRILENPVNVGASSSRNRAWDAATMPYVALLDSDDAWHTRKIEIQYRHMAANPALAASGHGFEILRGGAVERPAPEHFGIRQRSFRELLFRNYFVTPGAMFRRDIPERFQEGRSDMEDHLLWIEIAANHGPIDELQIPLCHLFKAQWGEGGLGSRMWAMERGELRNYAYLRATGRIGLPMTALLTSWSLAKFVRRLSILAYRRIAPR